MLTWNIKIEMTMMTRFILDFVVTFEYLTSFLHAHKSIHTCSADRGVVEAAGVRALLLFLGLHGLVVRRHDELPALASAPALVSNLHRKTFQLFVTLNIPLSSSHLYLRVSEAGRDLHLAPAVVGPPVCAAHMLVDQGTSL